MLIFAMALISQVQAIYFYLEKDQVKCFKDEVVKNYVSLFQPLISFIQTLEMTINILDKEITKFYDEALTKGTDGI